jgi:hypothetical protein
VTEQRVWDQAVVGADGLGSLTLQPPTRDDWIITRILCSATTPAGTPLSTGGVVLQDTFTRTVAGGWGSPDTGGAWQVLSGTAATYSVGAGVGTIAGAGLLHAITAPVGTADMNVLCQIISSGSADDSIRVLGRVIDASNYYFVEANSGAVLNTTLLVKKRVAGTETQIGTATATFVTQTGWVRLNIAGINIAVTGWDPAGSEPAVQATIIDTDLVAAGDCGAGHGTTGVSSYDQFYVSTAAGVVAAGTPTWFAYIGNTTPTSIVDSSETAKAQWVPLLVNGLRLFQGEPLVVQAAGAAAGTTVVLSAYIQQA